jgi:hypothetical protein
MQLCCILDIRSLEVQVQLFDALVAPVLGYCSDVWAPTLLRNCDSADACMDNDLHKVQSLFMRQALGGLRRSTSRRLLLWELGCSPVVRAWFHSMVSSWNRMIALSEESPGVVPGFHGVRTASRVHASWWVGGGRCRAVHPRGFRYAIL